MQQLHYDLEHDHYHKVTGFIDGAILDAHIEAQVKKSGKTRQEVEEKMFAVKEPSDKEAKKWFEENRHRMPPQYSFEQIKADIKRLLQGEQQKGMRTKLVNKLKKDQKIEIAFAKPEPPKVELNVDGFPSKGAKKPKVTIVEFADYQCPHCAAASKVLKSVLAKYSDKAQLTFVDFPINRSGISKLVAQGAYCANKQDKYWQYHELAFEKQKDLKKESPSELAKEVKLDMKKFDSCFKSKAPEQFVDKAKAEGDRIGVSGTPAIYINGLKVHGYGEEELEEAIKEALKGTAS
jgi:protein-disulfide isomerase